MSVECKTSSTSQSDCVTLLCTFGRHMEQHVREELSALNAVIRQHFQGRILFSLPEAKLQLVQAIRVFERLFLCLLCKSMTTTVQDPSQLPTLVADALADIDMSAYCRYQSCWRHKSALSCADKSTRMDRVKAKLFVKMRPKCLISQAKSVHLASAKLLEKLLDIEISSQASLEVNTLLGFHSPRFSCSEFR